MLGMMGPQHGRGVSATQPDVPRFVEGFVVAAIDALEINNDNTGFNVWRGQILATNWRLDDSGNLVLSRSSRKVPVANLDNRAIAAKTYVRAEYHPGLREYVIYWQACGDFGLTYPAEGDPEIYSDYIVTVEDQPDEAGP